MDHKFLPSSGSSLMLPSTKMAFEIDEVSMFIVDFVVLAAVTTSHTEEVTPLYYLKSFIGTSLY
jgi:hypothetical protein